MTTMVIQKRRITGTACGGFDGVSVRVVGIHTSDTMRGWFKNTSHTRGNGGATA